MVSPRYNIDLNNVVIFFNILNLPGTDEYIKETEQLVVTRLNVQQHGSI